MKMTDTSIDTLETSYDTTTVSQTTDTTLSEDDDDELLALRIAALESIKLQKSKASEKVAKAKAEEVDKPAQQFVVKSHPKRSNLLSIVTCEEDQEKPVPEKRLSPPPLTMPYFDPTRPPPGLPRPRDRFSPLPPLRRSRSPMFRRYRSRSPGPGRRPWSRSPPPSYLRRRSTSPPPFRRRRSFSRSPPRRSPPRRRSPGVKSPVRERTPSLSESEWETDTETEEEQEEDTKEEEKKEEATDSKKKEETIETVDTEAKKEEKKEDKKAVDDEGDDVLKLDATAEEDEFSAFLNEFEDEVLAKKEEPKKKVKKERPITEKKVVDGKKLRKKIKPKKPTPPPSDRRSKSPKLSRSPGRRYFSPGRGKDNRLSPSKRDREDRASQDRLKRSSKSKDRSLKDAAPVETAAERAAREQKEYEERISKLSTPERERMEARRKKFEKKIDTNKKISLKSDKAEEEVNFEIKRRNRDSGDSGDNEKNGGDKSPPVRRNVTDLRVQLHKKRKAQETEPETKKSKLIVERSKNPLLRSVSPSPSPDKEVVAPVDLEEDDFGPIQTSGRRKVVAPTRKIVSKDSEEESDRSPSPPTKVPARNGQKKIVVLRKKTTTLEDDFSITRASLSPSKGLKKSLHLRLGGKVESEDADKDIYMDILRDQEAKKKAKKLKKEKKKEKKEKKKSKKRKDVDSDVSDKEPEQDIDSDEELFRFFEEPEPKTQKRRSKEIERQLSGDLVKKKFVRAKFDSEDVEDLVEKYREDEQTQERRKVKSKRRISNEGSLDEESSDLLEKMRKKNEKRLRRMKEIERDRIMFS